MTRGIHTAVAANNWEALIGYVKSTAATLGARGLGLIKFGGGRAPSLEIELPCCGMTKQYQQPYQIPVNSVGPCPCGNWFIRYRAEPLRVSDAGCVIIR